MIVLDEHIETQASPIYDHGKLDPSVHAKLVLDMDRYAAEAGIQVRDITGAAYHLTPIEIEYLTEFRRTQEDGKLGIVYIGAQDPSVSQRSRSIAGALIRNFITANVIPREALLEHLFKGRIGPQGTLVAVPDFHYHDAPAATRRALSSWLMGRASRGKQTVIGVPDNKAKAEIFGSENALYLNNFKIVQGYTA